MESDQTRQSHQPEVGHSSGGSCEAKLFKVWNKDSTCGKYISAIALSELQRNCLYTNEIFY